MSASAPTLDVSVVAAWPARRALPLPAVARALVVGGALSLPLLIALRLWLPTPGSTAAQRWTTVLAAISTALTLPHFISGYYRLYSAPSVWRRYPLSSTAAPLLLVVVTAACLMWPQDLAPYVVKLFVVWAPYHFGAQAFGVTLYSLGKQRQPPTARERRALALFLFSIALRGTLYASAGDSYMGLALPPLLVPTWAPTVATGLVGACALQLVWYARTWPARFGGDAAQAAVPVATHTLWWTLGGSVLSTMTINASHSLQQLALTYLVEPRRIGRARWRWLAIGLVVGGGAWLLFYGVPRALTSATGRSPTLVVPVVWAVLQLHHYLVDALIWRRGFLRRS